MKLLIDRILQDGKNLGNGILKVDGFVNHQVDPVLMDLAGREFSRFFKDIREVFGELNCAHVAPITTLCYCRGLSRTSFPGRLAGRL